VCYLLPVVGLCCRQIERLLHLHLLLHRVEFVNQIPQGVVIFFFVSLRCQAYRVVVLETMVAGPVDRNIAGAAHRAAWPTRPRRGRQTLGHVAVLDDRDFVSTPPGLRRMAATVHLLVVLLLLRPLVGVQLARQV